VESVVAILGGVRGETAALAAALCWAIASVGWGRAGREVAPLELNFIKGSVAVVLLALTIALRGGVLAGVEWRAVWLLALSGAVGIGLGDTAYFEAINSLGARRALLLTMIAPPLAAVVAWAALGERLVPLAWIGMALTIAGVAWVITERIPGSGRPASHLIRGVWMGVLASLAQVAGAVLTRAAFAQTSVTPLISALLRMSAAVVVVFVWIALSRAKKKRTVHHSRGLWGLVLAATFIGTYLGISLQQFAFKFANTGVAQTLLSVSPLFILPITVMMGEKVSARAVAGVVVALAGIAVLFGIVG
jgi:drug/metabolite transporter (DMT)-like permease